MSTKSVTESPAGLGGRPPAIPDAVPTVVIRPRRRLLDLNLAAIWEFRELLFFLVWRDIKVRYKQTAMGAAWAVLQPLLTMVIFTIVFGNFAGMSSDGFPYPIFTYCALLPWNLFANALNRSTASVVGNSNLVSKVYFPRLVLPLSAVLGGLVDFGISFVILIGMMMFYGIAPTWGVLALPAFIALSILTALAVGLWLSALNVRYRDVAYTTTFLVQFWMYASPVAYSVAEVPERWRLVYSLNPMAGVIEGFRWALLGKETPEFGVIAVSTAIVFLLLFFGTVYFRHLERTFADIV